MADALAANRGLVEHEGKRLPPGADGLQRRDGGFDIGDARACRDQTKITVANGGRGRGIRRSKAACDARCRFPRLRRSHLRRKLAQASVLLRRPVVPFFRVNAQPISELLAVGGMNSSWLFCN